MFFLNNSAGDAVELIGNFPISATAIAPQEPSKKQPDFQKWHTRQYPRKERLLKKVGLIRKNDIPPQVIWGNVKYS